MNDGERNACRICGKYQSRLLPEHTEGQCIAHLQNQCRIMREMLGTIFEPYERMGQSAQDFEKKRVAALAGVERAHMMIGQLTMAYNIVADESERAEESDALTEKAIDPLKLIPTNEGMISETVRDASRFNTVAAKPTMLCSHQAWLDSPGVLHGTRTHICVECGHSKVVREEESK